jgi:nucleotide-binding universal stress UspA family protein
VLFASRHPGRPATGPPAVGRTARFVLDHAPCPVLLLRG